jgi:DNA-binding NarL/FixJ family response regulator
VAEGAKRPRVVIVEDYVLIQENIRLVLESDCDVVATAEDGETALAAVTEFQPDVITLDVSLPGSSGFTLARKFQQTHPAIALIFVTAYSDSLHIGGAFDVGASGYVLKGSMQSELPAAIRKVCAGGRYLSPALHAKAGTNFS